MKTSRLKFRSHWHDYLAWKCHVQIILRNTHNKWLLYFCSLHDDDDDDDDSTHALFCLIEMHGGERKYSTRQPLIDLSYMKSHDVEQFHRYLKTTPLRLTNIIVHCFSETKLFAKYNTEFVFLIKSSYLPLGAKNSPSIGDISNIRFVFSFCLSPVRSTYRQVALPHGTRKSR